MLALKNVGIKEETHKARFVVQEHRNAERNMIVHSSTNLKQLRSHLIISLKAIYGFVIWTQDIFQAYQQSKNLLSKDAYVKPKGCVKLKEGQ